MALKVIRKAAIIFALTVLGIISFANAANQNSSNVYAMSTNVKDDIYEEALSASLLKELQQASNNYYENSYPVFPTVELDTTELQQIYKQKGKTILEFKIMPFIGPHNTVGIDHLTLSLDNRGNIMVVDYKHSENF